MCFSLQNVSHDQKVGNDTVHDLKKFDTQTLATQAEKTEQLVSMTSAIKKAFDPRGDDICELATETESLKKIGSNDEKRLGESKAKLLKQIDDERGTILFYL